MSSMVEMHFWNLRPLRHFSERFCFITSCIANAVLAVLLIRERNEIMRPYSRVLLLNCFFDVFYTIVCMAVEVVRKCSNLRECCEICVKELEMNEGYYIFVINGLPKAWSYEAQLVSVAFWNFAICMTAFLASIEFTFRYLLVVRYKNLFADVH